MTVINTHMRVVLGQSPNAFEAACQNSLNEPNFASFGETLPRHICETLSL